jgi:hypothetical protein
MKWLIGFTLVALFHWSCAQVADKVPKTLTDCDKRISITGIFSPCSSDTIPAAALLNDVELKLNDSSYRVTGFEILYATKSNEINSRTFEGNKAVYNVDDEFWKNINKAEAVFIDQIRIRKDTVNRKLSAIVKYVR